MVGLAALVLDDVLADSFRRLRLIESTAPGQAVRVEGIDSQLDS
jgi:hypothetical protein